MITGLEIANLAISRGDRLLFSGFDLRVEAGEAVAVTGPNGAGKTSLLRAIAGLLRPDVGSITFKSAADADDARRNHIHLLGHQDGLKSTRLAYDELAFQARWAGGEKDGIARATEALALAPLLDLEVRMLSAGQRRRLALARLVAAPRALWLLDEPLAPLDAANRARSSDLMTAHLAGGGMIVAAVHDPLPIPARAAPLP